MEFRSSVRAVIIFTCITMGAGDGKYSFKVMFTDILPFIIQKPQLLWLQAYIRFKVLKPFHIV